MSNGNGLGYRIELENRAALRAGSSYQALPSGFTAPHRISHRGWRRARNQGQVGRCTGRSRASGEEVLNYIASGGAVEEFSGDYAYIQNQKACGLFGKGDVGATIHGSVKAALETGICRLSLFPQPEHYEINVPAGCEAEGRKHVIRQFKKIDSAMAVFQFLASGAGVILIGVEWTSGMQHVGRAMELDHLRGDILGGHAMVIHGYDDTRVSDNIPYFDLENSHGAKWGENGFCLISPRVVDHWIQHQGEIIGISDQEVFSYRPIETWRGMTG